MAHSSIKVIVHIVWTTKDRCRLLTGEARSKVREHIVTNASYKQITLSALAVQPEHAHALVFLSRSQCIDDMVRLMKGESSHWINSLALIPGKFAWQTGYWAGSVSCHDEDVVKVYIQNQDEHHRRKSFAEEFETMLRESGYSEAEMAELLRRESH